MSARQYGAIRVSNGDDDDDDDAEDTANIVNDDSVDRDDEASPLLKAAGAGGSLPPSLFRGHGQNSYIYYWSFLTFDWISPLLAKGNVNGQLNAEDLKMMPLPRSCQTNEVYAVFSKCWEDELDRVTNAKADAKRRKKAVSGGGLSEPHIGNIQMPTSNEIGEQAMITSTALLMDEFHDEDDLFDVYQHQPSLIWTLYHAFGAEFLRAGLLKLVHDSCLFVGPQVLNRLIHFMRDPHATMIYGFGLMIAVTCSQITISICLRHYFYKCTCAGLRIRTAVIIAIYKKSLVLSLKERHRRGGPGQITTLIGIDAQRLQDLLTYLHAVWYSFFQIGVAMYFLWGQVGSSCLAGLIVIVLMIPTTNFVARWLGRIQKSLMKARDARTSLNSEMLGAMKVIKTQAWEEDFRSKLLSLRNAELDRLWRYFLTSGISVTMYSAAPLLVALATFAAYTAMGNTLDVATALTALALFDIIRFPMIMLPQIVNSIVEAGISIERIREFLLSEEYSVVGEGTLKERGEVWMNNGTFVYDSKKPIFDSGTTDGGAEKNGGIKGLMKQQQRMMKEAQFDRSWEMMLLKAQLLDAEVAIKALERELHPGRSVYGNNRHAAPEGKWSPSSLLSLRRVFMHCQPGEFVAVVGGVGAGKSTLINSILGEGRPLIGSELMVKGKIGAFLQTPFIMNETVRENILFGRVGPVDEERYQLALQVCSLSHDLKLLSHGDQTEIGERGITLSGGQKARVALARAVYHDADVYLLDDPLAAVDAHVGKDLFNKCIVNELLLGKSKVKESDQNDEQAKGWTDVLLGRSPSPSKQGSDGGNSRRGRNSTVILVTNALQHLSHPMLDRIIVLDDGCVQEVGSYAELSSNHNSRFSAFLKTISDTSTATIEQVPTDVVLDGDDASDGGLDCGYGGDEPEVTKIIRAEPRRSRLGSITIGSTRRLNTSSRSADGEEDLTGTDSGVTMTVEEKVSGSVDRRVYIAWAKAGGGISVAMLILAMFVLVELLNVSSKWWLTNWSQSGGSRPFFYLEIYALINVSAIVATFFRLIFFVLVGLRASRSMFEKLLDVILEAPMSFFDTTPIGRIINRFSKDMYTVDEQLIVSGRSYLTTLLSVISAIFVVIAVTPMFIIGLVPIMIFYVQQQNYFTMSYRELKRLDSTSRSPIYALLGESLDGVLTIRAFEAEESLTRRMLGMLDIQQTAYYLTFVAQNWLSIRLEFAGTMIVMCACLVAVLGHNQMGANEHFAGLAGLSISFALSITSTLNWTVRMASDLEGNFVAVERIQQYMSIPGEAPRLTDLDESLSINWPNEGRVEFINVKLRYRMGLPLVLKGLNISIPARSKVGVVGRTGAGKSTLMVALLRIVELASGSIEIDGIDIKSLGLKKLRSIIAVIPQDPVLFSGSIRTNLDPFGEYDDTRLLEVLDHVGLFSTMEKVSSKTSLSSLVSDVNAGRRTQLSEEVSAGGNNFSVGQRQLIVIARAMLTGARIVIMDEATASVDADTDARIQRVFRLEFNSATCITVAHRLNTIMDSDYVLVMDDGMAAEFDKPSNLLSKEDGIFKSLVEAWEE